MKPLEYVPSTMPVVQRSVMYTPGNNARLIEKARTFTSDLVVLDLEDSVAPTEKESARCLVGESTAAVAESGADVYARLNAWDTGMTDEDLEAIVGPSLDGVVLPKTESPEDVLRLDEKLSSLEEKAGMPRGAVSVQLLAETAKGIVNAEASGRSNSRVNSIVFGAVDYARDMRIKLTGAGTIAARSTGGDGRALRGRRRDRPAVARVHRHGRVRRRLPAGQRARLRGQDAHPPEPDRAVPRDLRPARRRRSVRRGGRRGVREGAGRRPRVPSPFAAR